MGSCSLTDSVADSVSCGMINSLCRLEQNRCQDFLCTPVPVCTFNTVITGAFEKNAKYK